MIDSELRNAFKNAIIRIIKGEKHRALMGRDDGGGSFTYTVPGGHGYTFVRDISGQSITLTKAINRAGVANTGDLSIWIEKNTDGVWEITGERYSG